MERYVPARYREAAIGFARNVANHWMEPKPFESTTLYEKLGVRVFKKYIPITGDWARTHHIVPIESSYSSIPKKLRGFETYTRYLEGIHIALAALATPTLVFLTPDVEIKPVVIIAFNVLLNIYPIMVQRYNRIRFNSVIARIEGRQEVIKNSGLAVKIKINSFASGKDVF